MKKLLLCFPLFIFNFSLCNAQSWNWGREGYGPLKSNDYASPVATDKDGNVYITGQYDGTIIFGNDTLTDLNDDAYLTKYNSSGTVMWTKQLIDSTGNSFGNSVATDKSGNVYITGTFAGNAKADTFSLANSNYNASTTFLIKYKANGTVLWAKQGVVSSNPASYGTGYSVATDKVGNVFVAGSFQDTITFGSITLKAVFYYTNVFLVKYDSNGTVLWAEQSNIPSGYSSGRAYSVATDNSGNCYVTGYFSDTISFGATTLASPVGLTSGFLVKYSSAGNIVWAKQTITASTNSLCNLYAVITDQKGRPYITGNIQDTVSFGSFTLHSPSEVSACLAQYDTNGNVVWAKQSSVKWQGTGLASDAHNNIYMAGDIYKPDTIQKNPPDSLKFGNYSLLPDSGADYVSFLMKFDTSGTPVCGSILNNLGSSFSLNGVASDLTGAYIYTASALAHTVFCGPDTLLPYGSEAIFLGRWFDCSATGINEVRTKNEELRVYPNPSNGNFTIQSSVVSGQSSVEVYNMLGEKVYFQVIVSSPSFIVDLSGKPTGMYFIRVIDANNNLVGTDKIVVQ